MPSGSVIAVSSLKLSQIPGSGCTTPNPVNLPSSTHPAQIAMNAPKPTTRIGQVRTRGRGRRTGRVSTAGVGTAAGTGSAAVVAGSTGWAVIFVSGATSTAVSGNASAMIGSAVISGPGS